MLIPLQVKWTAVLNLSGSFKKKWAGCLISDAILQMSNKTPVCVVGRGAITISKLLTQVDIFLDVQNNQNDPRHIKIQQAKERARGIKQLLRFRKFILVGRGAGGLASNWRSSCLSLGSSGVTNMSLQCLISQLTLQMIQDLNCFAFLPSILTFSTSLRRFLHILLSSGKEFLEWIQGVLSRTAMWWLQKCERLEIMTQRSGLSGRATNNRAELLGLQILGK